MRRVVTNYALHRAASGRLSSGVDSSEPDKLRGRVTQIQNVPRGVRDIVVAGKDHVLVQGDWAGIEWAVMMWMASKLDKDNFHLDILDKFQEGKFDPHTYLASHAFGIPESEVTHEQRKTCKPYTHGRNYLGSERTLARNAGHPESVGFKVCGAHEKAFKVNPIQQHILAGCKKNHYVQTPLGWRRYFWAWDPKPTEVIATVVSATSADLCKVVLGTVFASLPDGWEAWTSTHDSILMWLPKEQEEVGKKYLKSLMEQSVPWLDGRTWRADVRSGATWKEVS